MRACVCERERERVYVFFIEGAGFINSVLEGGKEGTY